MKVVGTLKVLYKYSIYLFIHLSIYLPVYLPIYLCVCVCSLCVCVCVCVYTYIYTHIMYTCVHTDILKCTWKVVVKQQNNLLDKLEERSIFLYDSWHPPVPYHQLISCLKASIAPKDLSGCHPSLLFYEKVKS